MTIQQDPLVLVDTSVAVALCVQDHENHGQVSAALEGMALGLSGHAAFETFSVLTRLPGPLRRDPATIATLLQANFTTSHFLSQAGTAALYSQLASLGIAGGSIYDALVAAASVEARAVLMTRDDRALGTYRSLDAQVEFIR